MVALLRSTPMAFFTPIEAVAINNWPELMRDKSHLFDI
jgi:hypothetical protein